MVIRVFSAYWRFDVAFSTLTAERGWGGWSFCPEIPLQHTTSFCKTFRVLSRYVWWMYKVNKTSGISLLWLKIPAILHSIEFDILTCTMLKIAFRASRFQNFLGGEGVGMPSDPPRGSCLRRSYLIIPLNTYSCRYGHPSKNLSYAPGKDKLDWLLCCYV